MDYIKLKRKRSLLSVDLKIRVLKFYLKNGGDKLFGNKSHTAQHFNIGRNTVRR